MRKGELPVPGCLIPLFSMFALASLWFIGIFGDTLQLGHGESGFLPVRQHGTAVSRAPPFTLRWPRRSMNRWACSQIPRSFLFADDFG